MPVIVFQPQNEPPGVTLVERRGAGPIPWARLGQTRITLHELVRLIPRQLNTTGMTNEPPDKRCVAPARAA